MSVTFVNADTAGSFPVTGGGGSSPITSNSFTPVGGNVLLVPVLGQVNSAATVTRSTEIYSQSGSSHADGTGDFLGWYTATSVALAAAMIVTRLTDSYMFATALEYSGVASSTDGGITNGQTGATVSGSSQTVPAGGVLIAFIYSTSIASLGAYTPGSGGVQRDTTANLNNQVSGSYAEWTGTGAAITPSFTVPNATATYSILQIVLSPSSGGFPIGQIQL